MAYIIERYHDICCGHRVWGHEGKCRFLHGHNYRVHFFCSALSLDTLGRVTDFSVISRLLCRWLEDHWDHRFLVYAQDPAVTDLQRIDEQVLAVPFNPTAENIAKYLTETIGPAQLAGTGVILQQVKVEETTKCSATYIKDLQNFSSLLK